MKLKQELAADPRTTKQVENEDVVLIVPQQDIVQAMQTLPRALTNMNHCGDGPEKGNDVVYLADLIELFGDHLRYCVEE